MMYEVLGRRVRPLALFLSLITLVRIGSCLIPGCGRLRPSYPPMWRWWLRWRQWY